MAYNRGNTQRNTTPAQDDESWKARGFLNIYLPSEAGGERKLGAIKLLLADDDQSKLAAWLEKDPANIEKLASRVKLVYRSAERPAGSGFALD